MKGYTKQSDIKHGLPRWHNVKNPPANAGNARDMGSIPGPERSPGEGNVATPKSSILAWRIPRTEKPVGL